MIIIQCIAFIWFVDKYSVQHRDDVVHEAEVVAVGNNVAIFKVNDFYISSDDVELINENGIIYGVGDIIYIRYIQRGDVIETVYIVDIDIND